ncbi:hypothetical protein R6Q57_015034 [Mikania cordata]
MKSPFKKLRGSCGDTQRSVVQLDELSQASQDMQDMKDCYDTLLSSAAATANSAYEFSESSREIGECLLQKTSLNEDEDIGRVLLMLGKVQFQIQNLVDTYRSHISRTIIVPSESLLNELRVVEDMKRQCDQKRILYDDMKAKHKGRKIFISNKGEYVSSSQVRAAKQEFEEDATLFIFRMKSLKGGQSRSLLTQAARHHAAQMCFFRKALMSLETINPYVQLVTQQHHIDYQFIGLEDDDRDSVFLTDDEDDEVETDDEQGYGELSFDYQRNGPKNQVSSSEKSIEVELEGGVDLTFPQVSPLSSVKEQIWNSSSHNIAANTGSKSAPLPSVCPSEKFRQSSARKLYTYVLPTPAPTQQQAAYNNNNNNNNMWHSSPLERKEKDKFSGPILSPNDSTSKPASTQQQTAYNNNNMWHSSPLERKEKGKFSGPILSSSSKPAPVPLPLKYPHKRHAFSGPLAATPHSSNSCGKLVGGSFVSSPKIKISELHELPRPPGFSAPLLTSATIKLHST